MIDIEDLLTDAGADATEASIKASIYDTLIALGVSTTSWQPGAVTRTIVAVLAKLLAGYFALVRVIARSGFLDYAEGGWLTLLAKLVYGVERVTATQATGEITLDNASGGIYIYAAGEFVVKASATGKTYTNTAGFTLGALEVGLKVPIIALELGAASTAAIGQIDTLVTTAAGVTVTNEAAVVGADAESDADLRERCRDSLGALSPNGPKSAYEYVAKTPALVGGVAVTRVRVLPPPGDGTLSVVIAGAGGALAGGDVTKVQDGIDANASPEIATVVVSSAVAKVLSYVVDLHVSSASSKTVADWQTLVKDALVAWVKTLPIGGVELTPGDGRILFRAVIGMIEALDPYMIQASLTPESDTLISDNEVATLVAGDVTVNVTVV